MDSIKVWTIWFLEKKVKFRLFIIIEVSESSNLTKKWPETTRICLYINHVRNGYLIIMFLKGLARAS